jgi:hypothetical protein
VKPKSRKTSNAPQDRLSARARLRQYFLKNIGQVLTWRELREASGGITEWGRRVRELRQNEGYQILTHNDRADLKPGEYLLLDPKPVPAFEGGISKETRAFVLERNGYTCQSCGAAAGEPHPYDLSRTVRLQMGHVIDKSKGGSDDPSNLRAICSVCNEGLQNITPIRPDLMHLLVQVRRARAEDQRALLKWLSKKFKN